MSDTPVADLVEKFMKLQDMRIQQLERALDGLRKACMTTPPCGSCENCQRNKEIKAALEGK